jgi:hypothetical protein
MHGACMNIFSDINLFQDILIRDERYEQWVHAAEVVTSVSE